MDEQPSLEALVRRVEASTADGPDDVLKKIARAVEHAEQLSALGDALVDQFVQEARTSGVSWSQIGGVLGVSKQAAQQRFSGPEGLTKAIRAFMVELVSGVKGASSQRFISRFEPDARAAVLRARDEAHSMLHRYVGTEHLLLGILADPSTLGGRALISLGVTYAEVRERVDTIVGKGKTQASKLPFTARARSALERALLEAMRRSTGKVGTDDLAVALVSPSILPPPDLVPRPEEALAARILRERGVGVAELLERIEGLDPRSDPGEAS